MSLDGRSLEDNRSRQGVAARMRRSGSKILSIVGRQRNGGNVNLSIKHNAASLTYSEAGLPKPSSNTTSERDVAVAIAKEAAASLTSTRLLTDTVATIDLSEVQSGTTETLPLMQNSATSRRSPLTQIEGVHSAIMDDPTSPELSRTPHDPVNITATRQQNKSNSGLAHQISHKLSSTFGNPTIVHRPNLRTRPTLLCMHEEQAKASGVHNESLPSPHQSTAPSSHNTSGSISTGDPSTAKTSLESNVASLLSAKDSDVNEKTHNATNAAVGEELTREKPLTPIQEAPLVVNPTIVTVETTANAKIFFETHFNCLLAAQASPRSLRRHDLESRLEATTMSEEQREQERAAWAAFESEHLRQTRVLKSKTNEMYKASGVAVAGYEVVRILGKGSFGVVRLVREKDSAQVSSPTMNPFSPSAITKQNAPKEELITLKTTAIEALKATLDGQRISSRRVHKKVKKDVYAMKVIRKSDMLRNCQEGHLRAERDFLVASENSRWVIPLIASFQDATNLYLVMEYMVGGDFLGLLFRKDILKERHARWYVAEMILCVEEAHRLRWIHRDVKPDNFLITASGHLKISDFGLAFDGHWAHDQRYFKDHRQTLMDKLGIQVKGDLQDQEDDAKKEVETNLADILTGRKGRHHKVHADGPIEQESILHWRNRHGKRRMAGSVVGTSQYMAPEVIRGDLYDGRCDWWSIGIILFEVSTT